MIICIVGLPGSGKSTVAAALEGKGFSLVELGDIVRRKMHEEGIDRTHESVREYAMDIRKRHGKDIVARYAVDAMRGMGGNMIVSGVRSIHELNVFRGAFNDVHVLAVTAPAEARFSRLRGRGKPEDPKTPEEFAWLDQREKRGFLDEKEEEQYGTMKLMEVADYTIENAGTTEELKQRLDSMLHELGL